MITYHHKYCDKCYPQKTATIKSLKQKSRKLKRIINEAVRYVLESRESVSKKGILRILNKAENKK